MTEESEQSVNEQQLAENELQFARWFGRGKDRKEDDFSNLLKELRHLRKRYGLRPKMHEVNGNDQKSVDAKQITLSEALEATRMFREELAKYPPQMIRHSDIKSFRIVGDLKVEEQEAGGVAFERGEIYIASGTNKNYYRRTIHHELRHHFDYERHEAKDKFIGLIILDEIRDYKLNSFWKRINTTYGLEYKGDKWNKVMRFPRPKGFARNYGQKNAWEDRATVAEMLMTHTSRFFRDCQTDKALNVKTYYTMQYYKEESNGLMDEDYFRSLAKGEVNEEYWDTRATNNTKTN